jgi:hypothetical protein
LTDFSSHVRRYSSTVVVDGSTYVPWRCAWMMAASSALACAFVPRNAIHFCFRRRVPATVSPSMTMAQRPGPR